MLSLGGPTLKKNRYSFDFANCISCELYKPTAKTTYLLYLRKHPFDPSLDYDLSLSKLHYIEWDKWFFLDISSNEIKFLSFEPQ